MTNQSPFDFTEQQAREYLASGHRLDLAVLHCTFEGVRTRGGGVATVTRAHMMATPIVAEELRPLGIDVSLYIAHIAYSPKHPKWDPGLYEYAQAQLAKIGGKVLPLLNITDGTHIDPTWGEKAGWGDLENWKGLCMSAAQTATLLAQKHQVVLAFGHDIIYGLINVFANWQAEPAGADLMTIYVVHSSALTHELPVPSPWRLMAECTAMQWTKVTRRARLGCISEFMAKHILQDYGIPRENMVPTRNGVNPADGFFRRRTDQEIVDKLNQHQVPIDTPIVFGFGRAVDYKRHDLVLEVAHKLGGKVHPVILTYPEMPELEHLRQELGIAGNVIGAFDYDLIACLLQWKNCIAAPVLARNEPFGLTPAEIRLQARHQGPLLVVSDTGGLPDQVTDGVDGFITRQDDGDHVAETILKIMNMSEGARARMRAAGVETVLDRYTWTSNILQTWGCVLPPVRVVEEEARQAIKAKTVLD